MRLILSFLLSVLLTVTALQVNAQTQAQSCDGSLGDPVINQDFGSGSNPGAPLAAGITNMIYTSNNTPDDGYYTIANSLTGSGNGHQSTWHNVTTDHTGNPNGYMMIVNASANPSVFFLRKAPRYCARGLPMSFQHIYLTS